MKISSVDIYTYNIPLKYPLQIGNTFITDRGGVILRIMTDNKLYGFGEAAPLTGLHQDNLGQVLIQLKKIIPQIIGKQLNKIFDIIIDLQYNENWYSTVQFAIESALFNLFESSRDPKLISVLPKPINDIILVNSLITPNRDSFKKHIRQSMGSNFQAIKIKVGRQAIKKDIKFIKNIQRSTDKKASLRLDANRSWTLEEAIAFAQSIEKESIEYFEEPLKDPDKLPEFYEKTGVPIALDESLVEVLPENFKVANWIKAFILKPSVLGSVQNTLQFIDLAKKYKIKTVISDTFHTGIGLSFLIRLASIIEEPIAMGFDTYSWLADDILLGRLPVENGIVDLKTVMDLCKNIDYSKLQLVG